jgi:CubicO group peptidase (beta-lactamase class C family)
VTVPRPAPRGAGRALALVLVAALAACADVAAPGGAPAPVDLSQPWRVSSPAAQRMDERQLGAAYARATVTPGLHSLLVVRNGVLVSERYFGGLTADSLNDVRSVTKSVVSALVGIAIDRGMIAGSATRLGDLLGPPVATIVGAKADITVEQLLTMTSGFAWDESTTAQFNAWILAPDQITYLLDRPLADAPGTRFVYNSAAVHLLSVALGAAAGMNLEAFADRFLFGPLAITAHEWPTDARGYPNGGAGLRLRARDLAKLGTLYLQGGRSGARQVVPVEWVERSTRVQWALHRTTESIGDLGYGYLWWVGDAAGRRMVFAWGYRGQYVCVVPELQLVVIATAALAADVDALTEERTIMALIVDGVLPAAR